MPIHHPRLIRIWASNNFPCVIYRQAIALSHKLAIIVKINAVIKAHSLLSEVSIKMLPMPNNNIHTCQRFIFRLPARMSYIFLLRISAFGTCSSLKKHPASVGVPFSPQMLTVLFFRVSLFLEWPHHSTPSCLFTDLFCNSLKAFSIRAAMVNLISLLLNSGCAQYCLPPVHMPCQPDSNKS